MSEQNLTEPQRRATEARILHDAGLKSRGATITPTGRLALGLDLLEYVTLVSHTGLDATMVDRSEPPPHPMDAWLDTDIGAAWGQFFEGNALYRRFKTAGFISIRDLVTAGKACASSVRNTGPKILGKMEEVLTTNQHGVATWEEEPTEEYLAGICTRLSQVHAGALGLGRTRERLSVLDVLDTPLEDRPSLFARPPEAYITTETYARTSNVPEVFAVRFELARQALPA